MKSYVLLILSLIFCAGAVDKTALQKQFIATEAKITARIDAMTEADPTLKRRQHSIRDHQLHLSRLINQDDSIKKLAALKKANPENYLLQYYKQKHQLIKSNSTIREAYQNIIDLQDQFSHIINQDKVIKDLRVKLRIIKAQINK